MTGASDERRAAARELTPDEQADLVRLLWFWEDVYDVALIDDVWTARPIAAPADVITADSAAELREALRLHYADHLAAGDEYAQRLSDRMST